MRTGRSPPRWLPDPLSLSRCTFGAAEIYKTDGFGQNRDAQRASAVAQYEGKFGETGSYRVVGQAYSANYHSAGVLRDDDYRAGRVGFFDTYDRRQGGDSSRFSLAADLEQNVKTTLFRQQIYVIRRDLRLLKNYTGQLLDVQLPTQNPHAQRGDGIDLSVESWTIGSRGSSRVKETIGGLAQELEVGYSARGDFGRGTQLRIQSSNAIPYHRDVDVEYALGDIGMYGDANLRLCWLLRASVPRSQMTPAGKRTGRPGGLERLPHLRPHTPTRVPVEAGAVRVRIGLALRQLFRGRPIR